MGVLTSSPRQRRESSRLSGLPTLGPGHLPSDEARRCLMAFSRAHCPAGC